MKPRLRDKIFVVLIVIGLAIVAYGKITGTDENGYPSGYPTVEAEIKEAKVLLEVPQTQQEKNKGLGQRESMADNEGMLFVFDSLGRQAFVMTGMQFPLDFLFVQGDQIIDIAQNVPADFGGTIIGGADYDKVVEVNAGWTERNGVKLGDEVKIVNSK